MNNKHLQEEAAAKLCAYIVANNMRQTQERYQILKAVFTFERFFTLEDLQKVLQGVNFHVSTGTLYKNIALFIDANLVIRHPFNLQSTVYERVVEKEPRTYQVCYRCHKITTILSEEVKAAFKAYHPRRFNISHQVSYVYGVCAKCQKEMKNNLQNNKKQL